MQFTTAEIELLKTCIGKMLEINNHQHGELTCNRIIGTTDLSEDLQKLRGKVELMQLSAIHTLDPLV
jgi:hypothetical protein